MKGCVITLALAVLSLVSSVSAFAQVQEDIFLKQKWKKPDKIDFLYKASNEYLLGGTVLDAVSTIHLMDHPTIARRADGSLLTDYHSVEVGWAGCFGRENKFAAVGANVALNTGIAWTSRYFYRKGGHWRILAVGLNVLKGTNNTMAGIHNIRYDADQTVRQATGYNGRIIWSH